MKRATTTPTSREPLLSVKDAGWLVYLSIIRALVRLAPATAPGLESLWTRASLFFARGELRRLRRRMMMSKQAGLSLDVEACVQRYMRNSVCRIFDDLLLDKIAAELPEERIKIAGLHHLESALQTKRGVLLVSGHFFASRLAKKVLATRRELQIMSVRHLSPPDPGVGRLGRRWLQPAYMRFLHGVIGDEVFVEDEGCTMKMLQRLRQGGMVNVHMDAPFAAHTMERQFLGAQQRFPEGFIRMAAIAGSLLVPFWFCGNRHGLEVEFEPALDPTAAAPGAMMEDLLARLQKRVLTLPDQYELWIML